MKNTQKTSPTALSKDKSREDSDVKAMGIPVGGFKYPLIKTTPSKLTPALLQKQLNSIGLNCGQTHTRYLQQYIDSVYAAIKPGGTQSMGIYEPSGKRPMSLVQAAELLTEDASAETSTLTQSSVANWTPQGSKYVPHLEYIQYREHFEWLKKTDGSTFTGVGPNTNNYSGRESTVAAVKSQFINIATNASAVLVKGLDKSDMESVFSNAIATVTNSNASNYNEPGSKVIYLVDNYDPSTQSVDGIGVLTVSWRLTIADYKIKKQKPDHSWTLDIDAWAILYYDIATLNSDYNKIYNHFKNT